MEDRIDSFDIFVQPGLPEFVMRDGAGADAERATLAIIGDREEFNRLDAMGLVRRMAIPVVSLTSSDGVDRYVAADAIDAAIDEMAPLARRLQEVSTQVMASNDEALGLLAFLAVRERVLKPVSDYRNPGILGFVERERFPNLDELIAALETRGLLKPDFEDRVNQCPNCLSARILVRDQCPHCSSSQVRDQAVIHHFPCAAHAPEQQFEGEDGRLRCPKCRRHLKSVSVDYEVSTDLCECLSCGEIAQQPVVGFRCVDCAMIGTGEELVERDVQSYSVTASGQSLVFAVHEEEMMRESVPA